MFVDLPKAADVLRDVRDNGRVAVTFEHPMTNRCIQLKGRCLEVGDAAPDDFAWIERHRQDNRTVVVGDHDVRFKCIKNAINDRGVSLGYSSEVTD